MSRGNITRRGKSSWRIKFDINADSKGKRQTRYVTVKGKRQDAERELTRLLGTVDRDSFVEPRRTTVADYFRIWLDNDQELSPKTRERYRELLANQVIPHLGGILLQKLKPATIADWHLTLRKRGSKQGRALAARTVGHAHRLLGRGLQRLVEREELARNVARLVTPPKVSEEQEEVEILDAEQIATVLRKIGDDDLCPEITVTLGTGLRRGELLALRLGDVDLDAASLKVERSLEETKSGLRFKAPKTKHGRRTVSLPPSAVAALREHRRKLFERGLALGIGRPDRDALLFAKLDGSPRPPSSLTLAWRVACKRLNLPRVSFHALRHTHASCLIASGVDIVTISRRLGHANPTITLKVYAHLFRNSDEVAAAAIEAAMGTAGER